MANGFDARCTTQIINPLAVGHNSPYFMYNHPPEGGVKHNEMMQIKNRFTSEVIMEVPDLCGANLRGADLSEANLRYTDLRGADLREACLRGADLSGADLRRARGLIYAQISFTGHGESGRQLLAVKIDEQVIFFCGCFSGTEADLRVYIENGEENLKASRIFALETCLKAIEFQPNY